VRRIETVTTRWGDVRVKLRGWGSRVIDAAPEYDDCAALARSADVPFREVWNEAHRFAEVYVGRKIDDAGNLF
jgi:pyridinium-3,5-bisthiocarboxylic acid mononucleotide nickel chelatase